MWWPLYSAASLKYHTADTIVRYHTQSHYSGNGSMSSVWQGSFNYQFEIFGLARLGIEPGPPRHGANTLTTRLLSWSVLQTRICHYCFCLVYWVWFYFVLGQVGQICQFFLYDSTFPTQWIDNTYCKVFLNLFFVHQVHSQFHGNCTWKTKNKLKTNAWKKL